MVKWSSTWITLAALIVITAVFHYFDIDLWLQDMFYDQQTGQWILDRDNKAARLVFYDGVKVIYVLLILGLLGSLIFFRKSEFVQTRKAGIIIVVVSSILIPAVVGIGKTLSNTPCPRDLQRYGGSYPHVTAFSSYPEGYEKLPAVRCFPAGHASGGFALMSLYFLFRRRRNRNIALIGGCVLGWVIGDYKMLIGDHFISHTLTSMMLALLVIPLMSRGVNRLVGTRTT